MLPKEDISCYASQIQRELLSQLADHSLVNERFFLTGGTALSVFYLHHRSSDDLDFFTVEEADLSDISLWIRTVWQSEQSIIRSSPRFLSLLIKGVKVEFVIDPLSERSERPRVLVENREIAIDTLSNIAVNKLCTIVSRTEPKDFVDFYCLLRAPDGLSLDTLLHEAKKREALFDDPPTAAFQLEEALGFVRDHPQLLPGLKTAFDLEAMFAFYTDLAQRIYAMKP
jgi:hypothetical protein